jgi:N-acetylglucosamine-6-sulfatase
MRKTVLLLASMVLAVLLTYGTVPEPDSAQAQARPNFVFILTDDMTKADLRHMPRGQNLLIDRGTTFANHTITLPVCCPSRTTFLRGQYAHNHKIGMGLPGGEEEFREQGYGRSTVATWLDDAGYRTGLMGKYLNFYRSKTYVPPGWDRWYANIERDVWAREFNSNGRSVSISGNPDAHLAGVGETFIRNSSRQSAPFFLWFNFNAPHQYNNGPPIAMKQDLKKFSTTMPRKKSFNEADVSDKPQWIKSLPRLTGNEVDQMGVERRHRLASLQLVDRKVAALVSTLRERGEMDSTYIFFTSDNGYHMGEHRMRAGKATPYIEDVNVPLIVRGPGIEAAVERPEFVQNTDFAPTVAELAGAPIPDFVDGTSVVPLLRGEDARWRQQGFFEGRGSNGFAGITTTGGSHYVEYKTGERELYDMHQDPFQLENSYRSTDDTFIAQLEDRVRAIRECAGPTCRTAEGF